MTERYDKALTPEELAAEPDAKIDYSDIPELDEAFWARAEHKPPRAKPVVSLRVPADVVAFFKAEAPEGYTARMAAVLEAYAAARRE